MKKISYILLSTLMLGWATSCTEEKLTPSKADVERLPSLLDMSVPLVKDFKEQYGVNLIYSFDDTLDLKFNLAGQGIHETWQQLKFTHLSRPYDPANTDTDKDTAIYAINKLNDMVFSYFTDDYLRSKFPTRIFLVEKVTASSALLDPYAQECDDKEDRNPTVIGTQYSFIFGINKTIIDKYERPSADAIQKNNLNELRGVKLYSLLCHIISHHNLYKEIPSEFYDLSGNLHGKTIDEVAQMEDSLPVNETKTQYTPQWYIGLGYALNTTNDYTSTPVLKVDNGQYFPEKNVDFRRFLNIVFCQIPFEKEKNIETYYLKSPLFKQRMVIVLELLDKWGVDYARHNPLLLEFKK